jgi:hypothetical protein
VTFYNVISGILFMAAFQAFLANLMTPAVGYSAALMFIICNEAVLTSEVLESGLNIPYTLKMKFSDLGTFFLLSLALLVLKPDAFAGDNDPAFPFPDNQLWLALLLMSAYWRIQLYWNTQAKQNDETTWHKAWLLFSRTMWILIGLLALASAATQYLAASFEFLPGVIAAAVIFIFTLGKIWGRKAVPSTDVCRFRG